MLSTILLSSVAKKFRVFFHCALAFLALDTTSPYYGKGAPAVSIAEVIALLLAEAEDARRQFIESEVSMTPEQWRKAGTSV